MTKTALENKKVAAEIAKNERSARATERAAELKAASNDRRTAESARQFDKDLKRKWHETGAKVSDSVMKAGGTIGSVIASAINDPKFYLSTKGIAEQIGSIPTFYPLGNEILNDFVDDPNTPGGLAGSHAAASVIALRFMDTFGKQDLSSVATGANPNSNINLAMARFVTEARKMNSRIGEYEPGDAGQILIAASNIFERCAFVRKMLATYNLIDSGRTRIAEALFKASGLAFNLSQRAEALYSYNFVAEKANQALHVPEPFYYLERKIQLIMALYGDQDLRFGQYITVYKPDRMIYDEATATVQVSSSSSDLLTFINQIEEDINKLQYSAVLTTFWADIRGAYSKAYQLPLASKQDKLTIKPVTEALTQVLNADLAPILTHSNTMNYYAIERLIDYDSLAVRQDSEGFIYQGRAVNNQGAQLWDTGFEPWSLNHYTYNASDLRDAQLMNPELFKGYLNDNVLNFYQDKIETADIMVASRLKPTFTYKKDSSMYWKDANPGNQHNILRLIVDECGTEVPLWMYVERIDTRDTDQIAESIITKFCVTMKLGTGMDGCYIDLDHSVEKLANYAQYSQFDWMPKYYDMVPEFEDTPGVSNTTLLTNCSFLTMHWQTGNLCKLLPANLEVFNRAAILSEFTTPEPSQSFK